MRELLQILLTLLVLLGLGGLGYVVLFESGGPSSLEVVEIRGPVERATLSGEVEALTLGSRLHAKDELRVGPGGRAVLTLGDDTLALGADTRIRVLGVERSGVRVELAEGRIQARVRPQSPPLSVVSRGRAIRATDAEFTVAVDEEGAMVARAEAGSLELEGFGEVSSLAAGSELGAFPGRPSVVGSISSALLLEVEWPEDRSGPKLPLEGRTAPYASVTVRVGEEEQQLRAGPDGRFGRELNIPVGETRIVVEAKDATGQEQDDSRVVERADAGPRTQTKVLWGP
jgi:hypothetical protein